ncbi:MAG: ABC transporter ATP-binding protein [Planctomycetota bacterium]
MIEVKNVSKFYGNIKALDNVSFYIDKFELIGLLGPNGAGKTTLMRIIISYLAPTKGDVFINGKNVREYSKEIKNLLGYLPENNPLYDDMTVKEALQFFAKIRGIDRQNIKSCIDRVVKDCGLKNVYYRPIGELSKGYKQRVGLALALIHNPMILILDEPTHGLDPIQVIEIRNLLKELAKEKTVIISSHILPEVSEICSRILIINRGALVADGTLSQLINQARSLPEIIVEINAPREETLPVLNRIKNITHIETLEGSVANVSRLKIRYDSRNRYEEIVIELNEIVRKHNWALIEVRPKQASLENAFVELTK